MMFLNAKQRHEGENAALAVIVDAHREDHVFHGRDDDQRPQDQREDAKDDVGLRRAAGQVENGLERIKEGSSRCRQRRFRAQTGPSPPDSNGRWREWHQAAGFWIGLAAFGQILQFQKCVSYVVMELPVCMTK